MTEMAFPFIPDSSGRTAEADPSRHLRDLIEQVLLTSPGERVMRPDFGAGMRARVFAPAGDAVATALETSVEAALQHAIGARARILGVSAASGDGVLIVEVNYAPGDSEFDTRTLRVEVGP